MAKKEEGEKEALPSLLGEEMGGSVHFGRVTDGALAEEDEESRDTIDEAASLRRQLQSTEKRCLIAERTLQDARVRAEDVLGGRARPPVRCVPAPRPCREGRGTREGFRNIYRCEEGRGCVGDGERGWK
jgi:hypothetical protein